MKKPILERIRKAAETQAKEAWSPTDKKRHDRVKKREQKNMALLFAFYQAEGLDTKEATKRVARALKRDPETVLKHLLLAEQPEQQAPGKPKELHPGAAEARPEVPQYSQAQLQHFAPLALVARTLGSRLHVPDPGGLWLLEGSPDIPEDLDGLEAVLNVRGDPEAPVISPSEVPRADWRYYPDLRVHLQAEDPRWPNRVSLLKGLVEAYTRAVHALDREVARTTRRLTGLAYNPYLDKPYHGLSRHFCQTVLREAMRKQRHLPPAANQYIQRGGGWLVLNFDAGTIAVVQEGQEERLVRARQVHQALIARVRSWVTWRKALWKWGETVQAVTPLKEKLELVSRRGTFRGRCLTCP